MWTRYHVNAHQLANPSRRRGSRIGRRLNSADVAAHEDRNVACSDNKIERERWRECSRRK
jgi:hypothetical protein